MLADTKKRSDEYKAQRAAGTTPVSTPTTNTVVANIGTFNF